MRTFYVFTMMVCGFTFLPAQNVKTILQKLDQNLSAETRYVEAEMVVHTPRGERKIISRSWIEGEERAFAEYLSPPREKGTKMLKLDDNLWIYSPASDRVIQISGHMLRQSVMGSDLSYEDMMEDARLSDNYTGRILATDTLDQRTCWIIELVASNNSVSYYKRVIWVDTLLYLPLKADLYGKSEKLLKRITFANFRKTGNRYYPHKMTFKDMLKVGNGTTFRVRKLKMNILIPAHYFSKAILRR